MIGVVRERRHLRRQDGIADRQQQNREQGSRQRRAARWIQKIRPRHRGLCPGTPDACLLRGPDDIRLRINKSRGLRLRKRKPATLLAQDGRPKQPPCGGFIE